GRWSLFEIVGASGFVSAHSANALTTTQVPSLTAAQVAIDTGLNQQADAGDIAYWDKIRPDANGSFKIVSKQYRGPVPGGSSGGTRAYAITGLRLEEFTLGIISQPRSLSITPGDPASFDVGVHGEPPIFFH